MGNISKRVALVYDWVDKWGGAERVLLTLHDLFPDAPLYTSVYNPQSASWAKVFPKVTTTFLQNVKFIKHEWLAPLMPIAFESFDFSNFDLVISVSSSFAKSIITKPKTKHINYCLTPTRFLWSHESTYKLPKWLFDYLKKWDVIAAKRPDKLIAISQTVQTRIENYYNLKSVVVYPPVDLSKYNSNVHKIGEYFLVVSRLVMYKNLEHIIKIFNKLNQKLLIVGSGDQEQSLQNIANSNIQFVGLVTDTELASYYQACKALIYFHEEDFGLVPVEAMACGKPIIGFNQGGVSETVIDEVTGLLGDDLEKMIIDFEKHTFEPQAIKKHAQKFSQENFKRDFLIELQK